MKPIGLTLLLVFTFVGATAQIQVSYGELTTWTITNYDGSIAKKKAIIYFDTKSSLEQVLYILPLGYTDTTELPKEKKENIINEKGENVTKFSFNLGPTKPYTPKDMYTVFRSFSKQESVSKAMKLLAGGNGKAEYYILEDKEIDFGWQITTERKKIGDFECVKAISKPFRGRVYEAWFAPEIPISGGPWKLCGLPGLILEAKDQSGEVSFVMEKLTINPTERKAIFNPYENVKLPRITWEQYKKLIKEENTKMYKATMAAGGRVLSHTTKSIEMID